MCENIKIHHMGGGGQWEEREIKREIDLNPFPTNTKFLTGSIMKTTFYLFYLLVSSATIWKTRKGTS